MGSTVKQIADSAAETVGLPKTATYIGNTNQNAVKILRAIKDAARDVHRGNDWVTTRREHTFATTATSSYVMPTYFDRIVGETAWDRTNYRRLHGPLPPVEWQKYKSGNVTLSTISKLFRITSNDSGTKVLEILPTTDTGSTIVFDYITTRYVLSSSSDLQEGIEADTDTFVFDDELVEASATWRLLRMLGLGYQGEMQDYMALIQERKSRDGGAPRVNLQLSSVSRWGDPNIPDTGFGS